MPLRYDAGFEDRPMDTPILVSLFRAVGVVILLATTLMTVAVFQTQQSIVNIRSQRSWGPAASYYPWCHSGPRR